MNILISRIGMLGDTLFTIPAVNAISTAYPNANIIYVTSPRGVDLLKNYSFINKIIVYNFYNGQAAKKSIKKALINITFDLFFNFDAYIEHHEFYTSFLRCNNIYYMSKSPTTDAMAIYQDPKNHIIDNYLNLIKLANIESYNNKYFLNINKQAEKYVNTFNRKFANISLICIHLGNHTLNTNMLLKKKEFNSRFINENIYAQLCELLNSYFPSVVFAFTGSFFERRHVRLVKKQISNKHLRIMDFTGKTNKLAKLLGLLANAKLFISGDTGPLHLASALNVPCLTIFTASDPKDTGPRGIADSIVVQSPIQCAPCSNTSHEKQCPVNEKCNTVINAKYIFDTAEIFIKEHLK